MNYFMNPLRDIHQTCMNIIMTGLRHVKFLVTLTSFSMSQSCKSDISKPVYGFWHTFDVDIEISLGAY